MLQEIKNGVKKEDKVKLLKNSLTIRGDSLYCPLSLSLDSYSACYTDCHHCYLRNLNHVWGNDLKPADLELLDRKLYSGSRNTTPKTPLSFALAHKKTIRWGNKTDPFQEVELEHRISKAIFPILTKYNWTFVIQTKFTHIMMEYEKYIMYAHSKNLITIMPIMSPGLEKDWEIFERKRTTHPEDRLEDLQLLNNKGIPGGVNGEPFIPGYHTEKDFENAIKLLKAHGINRYNTYNFHFNPFVAKRLHEIGVDIERIWYYNRDVEWKKILPKLLDIAKKNNIIIGCPDFVNSGRDWVEQANTCCGIDVQNPCTFNTHYFKKYRQQGMSVEEILKLTYDGTADYEEGKQLLEGTNTKMFNLKDAGL